MASSSSEDQFGMDVHSWTVLSGAGAIKRLDKSSFIHRLTGIPIKLRKLFGVEELSKGERVSIKLLYQGREFEAYIRLAESARTRLFWGQDFAEVLARSFPGWAADLANDSRPGEVPPQIRFEKADMSGHLWRIELVDAPELTQGQVVSNQELRRVFGCGPQGGMRRSHSTKTLVIVSDHTKGLYRDSWDGDVLHYAGMGQVGDQRLDYAQNKTLNESPTNGVSVHLFEVFSRGRYVYQGPVELIGEAYPEKQPDVEGNERTVWVFPVSLARGAKPAAIDQTLLLEVEQRALQQAGDLSMEELRRRAARPRKRPGKRETLATAYERDPYVSELTKRRADGCCQLCGRTAPFHDKKGRPYLETHHIVWLSKGGEDTVGNTAALCPNCHRKMHLVDDRQDRETLQNRASL